MLNTLFFAERPATHCRRVLGLVASQAPPGGATAFSVPAHVMATLNVVLDGSLSNDGRLLPKCFATGAHTRSRRYEISPNAVLLTLFCRADAIADVSRYTDKWVSGTTLFTAFEPSTTPQTHIPRDVANQMLACASPQHLTQRAPNQQLQLALKAMLLHRAGELESTLAQQMGCSARSLQRLFKTHLGVTQKQVQRMLRIQACVQLWGQDSHSLADLAQAVGLVDQAHLAREFKQLVGYPPSSLNQTGEADENTLWALKTGSRLLTPLFV